MGHDIREAKGSEKKRSGFELTAAKQVGRFRKTDVIQYVVLKVHFLHTAQWLSWLERRPVTAKVVGSSPIWVVCFYKLQFISAGS